MFALFFMYALTTLPFSKFLSASASPSLLIALRMLPASFLLLSYCIIKKQFTFSKKHLMHYTTILFLAFLIPYFLRYWTLANTTSPRTDLLLMSGPLITFLLALLCGTEKNNFLKWIALAIGYIGLLLLAGMPILSYVQDPLSIADAALLCSIASFSLGWLLIARMINQHDYTPAMINGLGMAGAGIVALLMSLTTESVTISGNTVTFFTVLTATILISNCMSHTLYASLTRKYSLTFLQLGSLSIPLFAHIRNAIIGTASLDGTFVVITILIASSIGLFRLAETSAPRSIKAFSGDFPL